ncbi:other/FunK1 protein kinase [Coprinopsis cinerea okayama7|uniref:Other/FunK1 protein kinase n=1 Tax=Coprinopsis cinerea (strain Okayama-7 / 130 / ATCC MYA-4618 / FGSC 9003) TaxID=240176 RepID=A8NK58_COPC7|nr:other/FunK1 protein kinase [Coprinopsis cinerea okayama7\|eukprot:XP_001834357.1 other/FunK1 protein kinase [Coprinopsis cinerea okayama7\
MGRISDLEYCKRYQQASAHGPLSGAREFMSLDVRRWGFMHMVRPNNLRKEYPEVTFHHHYLHDLESVYWLLIWYMVSHAPHKEGVPRVIDHVSWAKLVDDLFGTGIDSQEPTVHWNNQSVTCTAMMNFWDDQDSLEGVCDILNLPVLFKKEYGTLQTAEQTECGETRWPDRVFTEGLYIAFEKAVNEALKSVPSDCQWLPLWDSLSSQ